MRGLPYSISILFILSCHEFGHYFAARYHKVEATLPFFMPFPAIAGFLNFGTLGAVIRTRSPIPSKKAMFDIGVAGPIAGFIATLLVLVYGFVNLPGREFILRIHPDYFSPVKRIPQGGVDLAFGNTAMYDLLKSLLTDPRRHFVPPMTEMYHYPFLCTGWFGLFVTAMNLLPVGQLDGGHISYTMFGDKHKIISRIAFTVIIIIGLIGFLPLLGMTSSFGWTGWLFWGLILFFVVKLDHPPVLNEEPLDSTRTLIGWAALFIFLLSFSPSPFSISI
ncbi:MAG: site-2 protease family protein [Bacteroidota bacterium]|nr:site-2 protease family protein [Bacteroidota bacterium]